MGVCVLYVFVFTLLDNRVALTSQGGAAVYICMYINFNVCILTSQVGAAVEEEARVAGSLIRAVSAE